MYSYLSRRDGKKNPISRGPYRTNQRVDLSEKNMLSTQNHQAVSMGRLVFYRTLVIVLETAKKRVFFSVVGSLDLGV